MTRSTTLALLVIGVFGVMYALIAYFALHRFPYSGDEYSLALQSELFARGMVKAAAPEHIEWLRVDHVVIDAWVRSKYPPGAPALVALGARHGVAWLVTPLEAVAALALVWDTTRRLLGEREAFVALVVLGIGPLYAYDAASFYTHTPTTLFLAIAFAAIAAWTRAARTPWLVLAGAAIGCAFLIRPLDAVLFGVAMVVFRSPRAVIITAASALPFVGLNLLYQDAAFGSPFTSGYQLYEPTFVALYGPDTAAANLSLHHLIDPVQLWNHIDIYRALAVDWSVPGSVIVALVGALAIGRAHPARAMRSFCIALIVVYAGSLMVTISDPDDGARPRYLSTALLPLAVLTAAGFAPTCAALASRFGARVRSLFVAIALVFSLAQLGSFLQFHIPLVWKREGLFRATEALPRGAIVVVRAQYPSRYARNGPFFDGVIYLSVSPTTTVETVAAGYPDREIWEAFEGEPWKIVRRR